MVSNFYVARFMLAITLLQPMRKKQSASGKFKELAYVDDSLMKIYQAILVSPHSSFYIVFRKGKNAAENSIYVNNNNHQKKNRL